MSLTSLRQPAQFSDVLANSVTSQGMTLPPSCLGNTGRWQGQPASDHMRHTHEKIIATCSDDEHNLKSHELQRLEDIDLKTQALIKQKPYF